MSIYVPETVTGSREQGRSLVSKYTLDEQTHTHPGGTMVASDVAVFLSKHLLTSEVKGRTFRQVGKQKGANLEYPDKRKAVEDGTKRRVEKTEPQGRSWGSSLGATGSCWMVFHQEDTISVAHICFSFPLASA